MATPFEENFEFLLQKGMEFDENGEIIQSEKEKKSSQAFDRLIRAIAATKPVSCDHRTYKLKPNAIDTAKKIASLMSVVCPYDEIKLVQTKLNGKPFIHVLVISNGISLYKKESQQALKIVMNISKGMEIYYSTKDEAIHISIYVDAFDVVEE